jgi:hypothetical protein
VPATSTFTWTGLIEREASAAKTAGVSIGHAELVLTTGRDRAGSLVVASSAAVYFQDRGGPGRTWSRLGWEEVDAVLWDDRLQVLGLSGVQPGGMRRIELVLASRGALVEVARERVASTLLASAAVRLGDQVCARVTARRQPGSGKVVWIVVLNGRRASAIQPSGPGWKRPSPLFRPRQASPPRKPPIPPGCHLRRVCL